MTYQITDNGFIKLALDNGTTMYLPSEDNGTPEWRKYLKWLEEGNTPLPEDQLPEPQELTVQEKLASAGLTIDELKEALGL